MCCFKFSVQETLFKSKLWKILSSRAEAAHSPFILNQVKTVLFSLQKLFSLSVFLCERSTTENECRGGWGRFPIVKWSRSNKYFPCHPHLQGSLFSQYFLCCCYQSIMETHSLVLYYIYFLWDCHIHFDFCANELSAGECENELAWAKDAMKANKCEKLTD